jgi:hypothetical protein
MLESENGATKFEGPSESPFQTIIITRTVLDLPCIFYLLYTPILGFFTTKLENMDLENSRANHFAIHFCGLGLKGNKSNTK